ncbi:putative protein phosphatase 2C 2 [Nymphaea thermarum]|nr:putative protein phosphatase 2C 2 [Nymphaea thermarum]
MLDLAELSWVISFISRLLSTVRMVRKTVALSLKPSASLLGLSPSPATATGTPSVVSPLERKAAFPSRTPPVGGVDARPTPSGATAKRKRPAMLVIPASRPESVISVEFGAEDDRETVAMAEGSGYHVASKRGRKHVMEDGHAVITNISEDPKHAFFGVFDGHGGRFAVDFVTDKLGKNIVSATQELQRSEEIEEAITSSYVDTDKEFLSQGVKSGACVATVLVKDGTLYAANTGDCRVVLSRNGVAVPLTRDHRLDQREDERDRINQLGGYVDRVSGVWRVQGSLAVSRAIGDLHLKEWVISEPEVSKLEISSDCQFLVMASDGLWDKVANQEAVEVILKNKNRIESCKKLVDLSFSRGNKDDVTVMVVDLEKFI